MISMDRTLIRVCLQVTNKRGYGYGVFFLVAFFAYQRILLLGKILLIHAGGYSTRLPHVSPIGKIFLNLPTFGKACLFVFPCAK